MQRTWDLGSEWTRGPEETRHTHTNVEDGVFWLGEAWRWPLQSQGSCRPCPIDGGGQGPPVPSEFPGLDPLLPGSVNDCPDLTPALPALPIDTTRGRPRGVLEPREAHGKPSSSCCGGGGGHRERGHCGCLVLFTGGSPCQGGPPASDGLCCTILGGGRGLCQIWDVGLACCTRGPRYGIGSPPGAAAGTDGPRPAGLGGGHSWLWLSSGRPSHTLEHSS